MASRQTDFEVLYELIDVNAKDDSTLTAQNIKNFGGSLDLLEEDEVTPESSKNILAYPYTDTTGTVSGVTFTDNLDGTVRANGTSNARALFTITDGASVMPFAPGDYILSGCPQEGSSATYKMICTVYHDDNTTTEYEDVGNGIAFSITDTDIGFTCDIDIESGVSLDEVFYPMVRLASITDSTWQPFSLKAQFKESMTLEHNFSVLDATLPEFPVNTSSIAFFSDKMSNVNGEWTSGEEPTLTVTFSRMHSTFSLLLQFLDDAPKTVDVTWMLNSVTLVHDQFEITGKSSYITQDVENYNKLIIKFIKTNPYHYVKFTTLYYGMKIYWNEKNVKTGKMTKEINPISDKIPIDTLTFEVVDVNFGDLNLGNSEGLHKYFQRNQPMYPREYIDGVRVDLGKFFLKTFSNNKNLGKMSCVSYMDLFDNMQFEDGDLYTGMLAGTLLTKMFTDLHISNFSIDSNTYNQRLYGALKPQTYRNALKEILFACQSIIDTSNPDHIIIRKPSKIIADGIGREIKFSTSVSQREYISGVEIKYSTYNKKEEAEELVKDVYYPVGYHKVTFTHPIDSSTVTFSDPSKVTSVNASTFFIEFTVTTADTFTISGVSYQEVKNSAVVNRPLDPGEFEKIKSFNSTLCSYETAVQAATAILEYYKKDLELKIKALTEVQAVEMYDMRLVANTSSKYSDFIAGFTSRSFNLTGGFIEDSKLVGIYNDFADKQYYADSEIIADDNKII